MSWLESYELFCFQSDVFLLYPNKNSSAIIYKNPLPNQEGHHFSCYSSYDDSITLHADTKHRKISGKLFSVKIIIL